MKNDLDYLFSKKEKASLGILSAVRNFAEIIQNNILIQDKIKWLNQELLIENIKAKI